MKLGVPKKKVGGRIENAPDSKTIGRSRWKNQNTNVANEKELRAAANLTAVKNLYGATAK